MMFASRAVESHRGECAKARLSRLRGASWTGILLAVLCPVYGFCVRPPGQLGSAASTSPAEFENARVQRPVTVADFIQMTRLGDSNYNDGAPSKGLVAKFSPDGRWFVVLLRKGRLETNTNEYSLMLF